MKALFLREQQQLSLEDTPDPTLQDGGDVIVRVTASSICGSDVHFWKGHLPSIPDFILGHEFVGEIIEVGSQVRSFQKGDRVAVPANPFCGTCVNCQAGRVNNCLTVKGMFGAGLMLGNLPGAQAHYVRVPHADACLAKIPPSVDDKAALLVGDVLSTGLFAIENGSPRPGDNIAVFGAGPVGLCAVACARLFSPAKIFLVDIEDYRLEVGAQLGATHLLNPERVNVVKEIKAATLGVGVNLTVDAVGLPSILKDCITCTAPGGTVSVVGMGTASLEFPMMKFMLKNLTLRGGLVPLVNMKRLLTLIEEKRLDVTPLITHTIKLEQIIEGYHMFADKKDNCIKVMVVP